MDRILTEHEEQREGGELNGGGVFAAAGEAQRGITKTYINSANPIELSWQDTSKIFLGHLLDK